MSQSGYLQNLILEVYAALEYLDEMGFSELLPPLSAKKIPRPQLDFDAFSFIQDKNLDSSQGGSYRVDPYAATAPAKTYRQPVKKPSVQDVLKSPAAAPAKSPGKRLSPAEIMAEAGYEPLPPKSYEKAAPRDPSYGQGYGQGYGQNYRSDPYPDYQDSRGPVQRSSSSQARSGPAWAAVAPPAKAKVYGRVCKEPPRIQSLDLSWIEGSQTIEELNQALPSCQNCSLYQNNKGVIPGRGPAGAPLIFVFDPPSYEAIPTRSIPVGPELEFFETVLTKGLKLKPEQVYVTSISKCPLPDPGNYLETFPMKACLNALFREIELVGPKAVISLGETAAKNITGMENNKFAFLRQSKWVIGRAKKVPMKVTFDLATVMELIDIKREFWKDLKEVLVLINDH
ncbi:MAG: hypothetical protein LBE80_07745 [Deltaproteobacteria bacterium]|jgi:DNA polymerase|nr:hypothetical protein [Deltaproteobacteria bacterium]